MKTNTALKESAGQFGPILVIALALALFVALVPSTRGGTTVSAARGTAGTDEFGLPIDGGATPADAVPGATGGSSGPDGAVTATGGTGPAAGGSNPGGGTTASGQSAPAKPGTPGAATAGPAAAVQAGSLFKGEDCSRRKVLGADATCRPIWAGTDNGGPSDRGVNKDTLKIVVYTPKGNEQVNAILGAAGIATVAQTVAALKAQTEWVNKNFELYGRKLEVVFQEGPGAADNTAAQQADAISVAEQQKAFAVVAVSATPAFHDELARRKVLNINGILPMTGKYLQERSPYTLSTLADTDLDFTHFSEYWCKRLNGRKATHAGDPVTAGQDRKLGVIYVESEYANLGDDITGYLKKTCGVTPAKVVSYPPDISRAAVIATNAIAQLRQAGVTSVTCVCDPVAPLFFTQEATKQGFFPEWIHNGFFGTDSPIGARLYDQTQWSHSFGPSSIPPDGHLSDLGSWNAYWAVRGGGGDYNEATAAPIEFGSITRLLGTMERLGPRPTTAGVLKAVFAEPVSAGNRPLAHGGFTVQYSFGKSPGPLSGIDDFMEIWWDPNRKGLAGQTGMYFYANGSKRYLAGQWPTTDPKVFVDDGSRQIDQDPQQVCKCFKG